jgi:uncharacterized Zn-binding protein involved in type VI secretion
MPPAARIDDTTMHGGTIVEGCDSVLIGRSPAARLGDYHECPMSDPDGQAHVGGPIVTASETVIIGGMPAARVGDECACEGPPVPSTVDIPAPESGAESGWEWDTESEQELMTDVTEADIESDEDSIEARYSRRIRAYHGRRSVNLRYGGMDVFGAESEADVGAVDLEGRARVNRDLHSTVEGRAERQLLRTHSEVRVGNRDNPLYSRERGVGVGREGVSGRRDGSVLNPTDVNNVDMSAGGDAVYTTRRTRMTTPTYRGQNIQLVRERTDSISVGGTAGYGAYYDEDEDRYHLRARIDTSAALALLVGPEVLVVPGPSRLRGVDLSIGRPYGPGSRGGGGGAPTPPPFAAGCDEIVTGDDTVLIGG